MAENVSAAEENVAVGETVEQETPQEEIPQELGGVSEETAREIMQEADEAEDTEGESTETGADADSENKQYSADDASNQRIPYGRFKEELAKKKELEEQNKALKAQLDEFKAQATQPAQTAQPQQSQQPRQQAAQPRINKDVVEKINEIAKQQAMQISGLTADDVDGMEYMDDDDPRKQQWSTAYDMAKMNVYAGMQQMQAQRAAKAQRFLAQHNAMVKDYNQFATKEMSEPDFEQIKDYATNDYFMSLPEAERPAIAEAYSRIERQLASPGDILLIKRYYKDAKSAYHSGRPTKRKTDSQNVKTRVAQAKSFPRSEQVSGAADAGGNVSIGTLEQMLKDDDWDNIPEKYRKMLLSGQISQ